MATCRLPLDEAGDLRDSNEVSMQTWCRTGNLIQRYWPAATTLTLSHVFAVAEAHEVPEFRKERGSLLSLLLLGAIWIVSGVLLGGKRTAGIGTHLVEDRARPILDAIPGALALFNRNSALVNCNGMYPNATPEPSIPLEPDEDSMLSGGK